MPPRPAPLGAAVRLLGVLVLVTGLVGMHGVIAAGSAHASTGATTTTAGALTHPSGAVAADGGACSTDHHGQSVAAMDCASAGATSGPGGAPLAAPPGSHLLAPAALPQWPSPHAATFAPPAAAPSHVILRT